MSPLVTKHLLLLSAIFSFVFPALADDTPAPQFDKTGSVLSVINKHGHFYQIATDDRIYLFLCTKVKSIQFGMPECKLDNKPIATGDTVHFRIDGDWAYMPPAPNETEQKLRIMATELKTIPPLPPAPPADTDKKSKTTPEAGVVIGTAMQVHGQGGGTWSTAPGAPAASTMSTGPVVATPVTGGPPVVVTPVSPNTGGVVTGVPVTGGPPIVAVPVSGPPAGAAPGASAPVMMGGGAPQWEHVMRIQTTSKIYQLECSSKPCKIANKEVSLGDSVSFRVDKKWAYIASQPSATAPLPEPQRYRILGVTAVAPPPAPAPASKEQ